MILAIDFGSTSFKAALVDRKLKIRAESSCAIRHNYGAGGRVELPVDEATTAVRKIIRAVGGKPAAVAVTSQAQTFTANRRPFISWQDTRAGKACASMRLPEFGRHCSFGGLDPALQLCQLKRIGRVSGLVVNLPTYFVQQWTGCAVVDENLAAMSGLYSLVRRDWWPAAMKVCGLKREQLPALCRIGEAAGVTNGAFGLPAGIPVVLAGNDQTAGAYGARLDETRGLLLTLGTAQVAYAYQTKMPEPRLGTFRGPYPGGGAYRATTDSNGGSVLNWARTILAGCETREGFLRVTGPAPAGCQGLMFDSDCLNGRGAWRNIGLHHTAPDFARSVLESLSDRMVAMVRQLGGEQQEIVVAGGGSQNPMWMKVLSEKLSRKLKTTDAQPLIGAARMALKAI